MDRERTLRSAERNAARGRFKQAIDDYNKLLESFPEDARLLLKVGDLYSRLQAYERAVEAYVRAARVYTKEGYAAKAIAVFKQVEKLLSTHVPHLNDYFLFLYPTLANLYQELRLSAEALNTFNIYASLLARAGRIHEAVSILQIVSDRGGASPVTQLRIAEILLEDGYRNDAVHHGIEAANRLVSLHRIDDAVRVLEQMHARTQAAEISRQAAKILLERGQTNDGMHALVHLQNAFRAEPKNLDTLELLTRVFDSMGQHDRAHEVRKQTVRIAKEQGAMEIALSTLATLRDYAPHDPDVEKLALSLVPSSPAQHLAAPPSIKQTESTENHVLPIQSDVPFIEETGVLAQIERVGDVANLEQQAREFLDRGDLQNAIHSVNIGLELEPNHQSLRKMLATLVELQSSALAPKPIPMEILQSVAESPANPSADSSPANTDVMAALPLKEIRGFRGGGGVSEALEEVEFFVSRGLFEDALAILQEQIALSPHHPELLQRFKEVEQSMLEADAQPSVLKLKQPIEQPSAFEQPVDVALPSPVAPANADIDSLFLMFKQGVETQVDAQDSRTQYDLGMMFMEMGRLEEARIAFENAAKDPARACVSLSMIASIHQRSGHAEQALQVLQRALSIECKSRSEEVGVQYELSRLFEAREQFSQAIQHLEQVVHLAPDFRDARTRLDSLRQQVHRGEVTIADDELERVFDDLIGPSKKA